MNINEYLLRLCSKSIVLIYGEAGTGKTNLALYIMSLFSNKFKGLKHIFISTEGGMFKHLISRYSIGGNTKFIEAINTHHLLDIVYDLYSSRYNLGVIVIDSINNFYRVEALLNKHINTITNITLAFLSDMILSSKCLSVILTAQVRSAPEVPDEIEVSGRKVLEYWSDIKIRLSRNIEERFWELVVEEPKLLTFKIKYRITNEGLKFHE